MRDRGASVHLPSLLTGAVAGAGLALLLARAGSMVGRMGSGWVRKGNDHPRDLATQAKERGRQLAEAAAGREATWTSS